MPRGYKRKRRRSHKGITIIAFTALAVLLLSIAWVWKSNQVKEYYATMKRLETDRANMIAENMRLRAALMDIKSISRINSVVTEKLGLTQDVSQRIFLADPVKIEKTDTKNLFAEDPGIPNWLEDAVIGSGRVRAESRKDTLGRK